MSDTEADDPELAEICERVMAKAKDAPEPDPATDVIKRLDRARVPRRHQNAILDGEIRDTSAMRSARAYMRNMDRFPCLVLAGATGCGKSVAAAWTIGEFGGVWIYSTNLGKAQREPDLWHRILTSGLLVIDDVGAEYADDKGWFQGVLADVIIQRYDSMLPTVLTTNLTLARFVERYGARMGERVQDGYCESTDPSFR